MNLAVDAAENVQFVAALVSNVALCCSVHDAFSYAFI